MGCMNHLESRQLHGTATRICLGFAEDKYLIHKILLTVGLDSLPSGMARYQASNMSSCPQSGYLILPNLPLFLKHDTDSLIFGRFPQAVDMDLFNVSVEKGKHVC